MTLAEFLIRWFEAHPEDAEACAELLEVEDATRSQ